MTIPTASLVMGFYMFLQSCLFVSTACRELLQLVCSGFRACSTSAIVWAINVTDPTSCQGCHHILSVSVPSRRGFLNRLPIFAPFFYDPTTFTTDPRVIGSDTGSAPVEHLHKMTLGQPQKYCMLLQPQK